MYFGSSDPSGYGRANGCDDNSIYQNDKDCEIWFDITQNDYDGDGIPYWTEVNVYGTNPEYDNTGEDADNDGVPIEWENKWGHFLYMNWWDGSVYDEWIYDPFTWEDHANFDPDNDGLDNVEEYRTSQWGSDPFRPDLFIELDQMEAGPNGEPASMLPDGSKELLRTAYDKQNIVYHLDDGSWDETGSEMIPFASSVSRNILRDMYYTQYFLHGNQSNWRRGVFHWGVVVYDGGFNGFAIRADAFQISSSYINDECKGELFYCSRDVIYASVYMHETGHSLGISNPGVDDHNSLYPWEANWWKWGPYKSCMNYRYCYRLVDYSDGSRGMNDFDDWDDLSLTYFGSSGW